MGRKTIISNDINDLYEHSGLHPEEFASILGCDVVRLDSLRSGISDLNADERLRLNGLASVLNSDKYAGQAAVFVRRELIAVEADGTSVLHKLSTGKENR